MDDRRVKKIFFGLLAIIVILRLGMFCFILLSGNGVSPRQDAREYRHLAENILEHGVFSQSLNAPFIPELLRTPVYPLFIAGTLTIDNTGYLAIALQQILIILGGILLFLIFKQHRMPWIGIVFTALWFLEPIAWFNTLSTMSDSFYTFLCVLLLFILIGRKDHVETVKSIVLWMALSGIIAGLMILTRPVGILWIPAILGFVILHTPRRIVASVVLMCAITLTLSPWLIRNYTLVHAPVISSSGAYNFDINYGNEEDSTSVRREVEAIPDEKWRPAINVYGYSSVAYPELKQRQHTILERVGFVTIVKQNLYCIAPMWLGGRYDLLASVAGITISNSLLIVVINLIAGIFWGAIVVCGLFGAYALYKKRKYAFVILLLGSVAVSSLITYCNALARIRIPLIAPAFLLAGFGVAAFFSYIRRHLTPEGSFFDRRTDYFETLHIPNKPACVIFLDIDGTLLPDDPHQTTPSKEVTEKVRELSTQHSVYLCTNGRDRTRARNIASLLNISLIESTRKKQSTRIITDLPLQSNRRNVVIGDKILTDGVLARRIHAHFYLVRSKQSGNERLIVRIVNYFDTILSTILIKK